MVSKLMDGKLIKIAIDNTLAINGVTVGDGEAMNFTYTERQLEANC